VPSYFENIIDFLEDHPMNQEVNITNKRDSMFKTVETLFYKTMEGSGKIKKVI
jgi:hypothetical protein